MRSRMRWGVAAMGMLLALPALGSAQMKSGHDVQVADLEAMKGKFAGLAEAIPESAYDWRPMEGVRSVREVLALMVAECHMFPTLWGYDVPQGTGEGWQPQMERAGKMSKADLMSALENSFDHMIGVVGHMDHDELMKEADFFGQAVSTASSIGMASGDMHEHLGQLIAYARANEVVPPWSRGGM